MKKTRPGQLDTEGGQISFGVDLNWLFLKVFTIATSANIVFLIRLCRQEPNWATEN